LTATLKAVRRIRLIALIAGVAALVGVSAPGTASAAGAFTWNLATDFTATGTGANPDHDQYGGRPWSYVEGPVSVLTFSHDPHGFQALPSFATDVRGGLAGWSDPADSAAFIGINPTGSAITDPGQSGVSYPAHALAMQAPADRLVAVGWTSPFASPVTVAVGGTIAEDATCLLGATWSLDQSGTRLLTGLASTNHTISDAVTVAPGGTIYFTLTPAATAACSAVNFSLTIQAPAVPPTVTLASPTGGAVISGSQPTFAGAAGTAFGDSPTVTVRVYRGSSVAGTPLETLTAPVSGGAYSVKPTTPLADGTYTAQAEQGDVVTPPQTGLSAPVTFRVANGGPNVTLNSFPKPLTTGTPRLSGSAGTASGDAKTVAIGIYAGAGETGAPVRSATATVGSGGKFSTKITPALPDGQYTAVAAQAGVGNPGISGPVTFEIKAGAPKVTLTSPASGASIGSPTPVFEGTAGTAAGDSSTITVRVYKGGAVKGRPVGTAQTTASGSTWALVWPHQLALGLYTVQASQSDNAGHTSVSQAHRLLIVPGPKVIGSSVKLSRSGVVSVPVACLAPPGTTCRGSVLIVTQRKYASPHGGPRGRLEVLFVFVKIPAGKTVIVHGRAARAVARVLRKTAPLKVTVTVALGPPHKVTTKLTGGSTLRRS
jgi:hypothetical protein